MIYRFEVKVLNMSGHSSSPSASVLNVLVTQTIRPRLQNGMRRGGSRTGVTKRISDSFHQLQGTSHKWSGLAMSEEVSLIL